MRAGARAWHDAAACAFEQMHTLARRWHPPRGARAAMRDFQARKLRVLLAHCNAHVGVYRDRWRDVAQAPGSILAPEAIGAWPTIGKEDLRERPLAATLADGVDERSLVVHHTSGSSGQPFAVFRSPREEQLLGLFRMRAEAGAGLRPYDRIAQFSQLPGGAVPYRWPARLRRAIGLHREVRLDGLADGPSMLAEIVRRRPDAVRGYPSTLVDIATAMLRDRQCDTGVGLVICGGEVLDASARRTIADAFAAPVVDLYGAHEFNLIAWECPSGHGYHVCDDNVVVEVLDGDGSPVRPGEIGEVVATALHSYTMPFVRYRTGDFAVRGEDACPCGAPWSTLGAIAGRAAESLRLPDGRRVHPYRITGALAERDADWVSQHQLVQTRADRVLLALAVRRVPTSGELERVRAHGASVLGVGVHLDVTLVDRFPREPGRKFRPYVPLDDARPRA